MPAMAGSRAAMPWGRALLVGTLAVGVLDILDAIVFFALRGAQPIRILQSIAAGLLGRAAFAGGASGKSFRLKAEATRPPKRSCGFRL